MKPQSRKAKGRMLQQWIAKAIYRAFPDLEEGDVESRSMGAAGVDLILSPKARKAIPLSIEAKSWRKIPSLAQLKQAKSNVYKDTLAVVVHKPHGAKYEDSVLIVNFVEFVEFIKEIRGKENVE